MRRALPVALAAGILAGVLWLGVPAGATSQEPADPAPRGIANSVVGLSTGGDSERVGKIAIRRKREPSRRVAYSLPLPRLSPGDKLRINAETAVSTTCIVVSPRCIGRRYKFSPRVGGQIILAPNPRAAGGPRTTRVSAREGMICGQRRPNRNHHCPIVIRKAELEVPLSGNLPCPPDSCYLNYVIDAAHRNARRRQAIVVGADRPDGSIRQDKGRLNAVLQRSLGAVQSTRASTTKRRTRRLASSFEGGQTVTYSQPLPNLRAGDVLLVQALQRTAISDRYPYFVSTEVVITGRPHATRPSRRIRRWITEGARATEVNGFNCTPGKSAFQSPCRSFKAGLATVLKTPGRQLYANLISRTFPKLSQTRPRYAPAKVIDGGWLRIQRLRGNDLSGR